MSASQTLGGPSRCGRSLGPSLDKIVKNAAWRKHSHLVSSCKSVLDKLESLTDSNSHSPLFGLSPSDAEFVLHPILLALDSAYAKVVDPALECLFKLFSSGLIRGEIDNGSKNVIIFKIIESVCKVCGIGDEAVELSVLRVLLSAVRSPCVLIRGECLVHVVRTCYNVYLGGLTGTNQICAKSVLAQVMLIVFTRVEEDSMDVNVKPVSVSEMLLFTDKNLNEGSSIHFCQNFVNEVMMASEGVPDDKLLLLHSPPSDKLQNGSGGAGDDNDKVGEGDHKSELRDKEANGEAETDGGVGGSGGVEAGGSKIREDGFLLFRNLCKLSMKFSSQETPDDQILLRGKILSLELLKVSQHYQAIPMLVIDKEQSGLKEEIGIFFPMLVLRVLENVNQPSFLQKMTVLNLLDKISQDSQIIIDIFVNYDCDVDAPNIYERIVNGLLKTALGPPPGSSTTLSSVQDITFRHESVKCLVSIIRSMGAWMDQQLRIGDSYLPKISQSSTSTENHSTLNGEDASAPEYDLHPEVNSETSDAATLEQRRAYKIELQKGISIFNRKPSKGIEFLINAKKVGGSPEEVAAFLKNTTGLNETVIGDYLGERDEFCLRVMHAYVDSFNFKVMGFGEAIRFFLRGFRLPGEAQKIDRIMEKFAERYCKCNPNSFTSADTAYVLAYSVIMLNTDAHNSMVKDKMSKADFIRNNRGIDDGKDLPEEYLGALYDHIVKNEIKMSANSSVPQSKQGNSLNKLLGLDGILNLVTGKQTEEKALGANGLLIRHIQEQFKAKSGKSEDGFLLLAAFLFQSGPSIYHVVTDAAILRFMVEVCWGPMLAAFSVTLDQSDDRLAASQCLQGFRYAVHVTAVMGMQTQRDAFVTSVAKFTYLHCAADMKQRNVDAVKAIISIAIEDGNNLQDAWEHILTCLSRIEHLQLLGEGAPPDASYLTPSNGETEEKALKSMGYPSLKKKGTLQNPAVMAIVRGGSYDSTAVGVNSPGLVSPEQINNFISNLNLLDQIGNFELNHVFANSQRLNSEAIVAFVKALCKVSISELQSPTDPRVFSLTKIVEIAHYNMNRIRLVWSRIWNVLSEFFVSVGLSENLSVAIFVMDSLRQLAMKFLEREELANYNFQNEFLRPFVIVMQKSSSTEIRELIVRCISQMVLSRVSNVKSGWKSVFMVFTVAAADERKNVVLLAFETMEKIVREYFPYITETETTTFTDCVRCLTTFTNSRFNSDVSLNAIAFLRFCALKLADGGLICNVKSSVDDPSIPIVDEVASDVDPSDKDDHVSFWIPLLTGLSKLTSDPRSAIRKSALEVLFNILNDHGHLFSHSFWTTVFNSAIFPIFNSFSDMKDVKDQDSPTSAPPHSVGSAWDSETSTIAVQCLVFLFVKFFNIVRSELQSVVSILMGFIRSPVKGPASAGVAALLRLIGELGSRISEDEYREIFLSLKEAAASLLPGFMKVLRIMDGIEMPESSHPFADADVSSDHGFTNDDLEDDNLQTAAYVVSRVKSHIAVQLLIVQVVSDLYKANQRLLSAANVRILIDIFSSIASHAHQLNSETDLLKKLLKACSIAGISDPPMVHFENESYEKYLDFLRDLLDDNPSMSEALNVEAQLAAVCETILQIYLNCTGLQTVQQDPANKPVIHWILPSGSAKKEELAARTSLLLSALRVLSGLERDSFRGYARQLFPLLVDLVRCEHSSGEVQRILSNIFRSCIGPIIMG
ncbi:hypothetical protein POTOM_016303 [Populus tomentosa]|uniref:SEC7 domain-containing protein n=1 Tax=Populus tomentosa TaxID=118781 RepID=A0A8X8CXV9_POPTO|nr:hypothetical protein POTOM_016303 [Populus tomentosa]